MELSFLFLSMQRKNVGDMMYATPWTRKLKHGLWLPGTLHWMETLDSWGPPRATTLSASVAPHACIKSPTYKPSSWEVSKIWTCVWFQQGTETCAISARCERNCSSPSASYCWWSFSSPISRLLSRLQSVPLLARSLASSPCMPGVARYYCTFQHTVL